MNTEIENIELSYLSFDDYQQLKEAMIEAYASMPNAYWKEHHIKSLLHRFPEGQVVMKINGQIAGCALSIIVNYKKFCNPGCSIIDTDMIFFSFSLVVVRRVQMNFYFGTLWMPTV